MQDSDKTNRYSKDKNQSNQDEQYNQRFGVQFPIGTSTDESGSTVRELQSYLAIGRKKFSQAVNATKESTYYKKVSQHFNGSSPIQQDGTVPDSSSILLYATYARQLNSQQYSAKVSGVIFTKGRLNRKNRLMLSMARRLSRTNIPSVTADQFEDELSEAIEHPDKNGGDVERSDDSDSVSISSFKSQNSASHTAGIKANEFSEAATEKRVNRRMANVVASSIPHTLIRIQIGSKHEARCVPPVDVYTNQYGIFSCNITTGYIPSSIEATSVFNPEVFQVLDIKMVPTEGISVISDVDDTIRVTGVLGNKIDIFRNIFSQPYSECVIPGVAEWYREMHDRFGCVFHYVSNSPSQIYNIVYGFLQYDKFPITSIHLKQYFGNIFSSVRMGAGRRKQDSLTEILNDFPHRRFILIGDSGEQDMEAYCSLCLKYGSQIIAIYIHALERSFSSMGLDHENVKELQNLIDNRGERLNSSIRNIAPSLIDAYDKPVSDKFSVMKPMKLEGSLANNGSYNAKSTNREKPLDSLKDGNSPVPEARAMRKTLKHRKVPPIVPEKPWNLHAKPIKEQRTPIAPARPKTVNTEDDTPPLPSRRASVRRFASESTGRISSSISNSASKMGHLPWLNSSPIRAEDDRPKNNQGYYSTGNLVLDEKFETWKQRILHVISSLPEHVDLRFWWEPGDLADECFSTMEQQVINRTTTFT